VPAPTRGSPRRRRSHAFAGPTRVALLLAISGAGERTQPSASEHHYESCGDSVVLRESCLRPARATEPQNRISAGCVWPRSQVFRAPALVVGRLRGPRRGVREKQEGDSRRFGSVRVWWQSPSSAGQITGQRSLQARKRYLNCPLAQVLHGSPKETLPRASQVLLQATILGQPQDIAQS